jgi:hypothetical protein
MRPIIREMIFTESAQSEIQRFLDRYRDIRAKQAAREANDLVAGPSEIQAFLDRYQDVRAIQVGRQARDLVAELSDLRPGFEVAKGLRSERDRLIAPKFDMFTVLGVENKESAHSNFLAELLDPAGRHGQGSLFLVEFLRICEQAGSSIPPDLITIESWSNKVRVRREATFFQGRCDMVIEAEGHLCVLIENKIDAPEEDTQLIRYRKWLNDRREPAQRRLLVFLTKQGQSAKSIGDSEYVRLSYVRHVREFLERTIPAIRARNVRSIIEQYLKLLAVWDRRPDEGTED